MKFAPIFTPHTWGCMHITSYQLVLGQHLEDPTYRSVIAKQKRRGDFIIVDNGAAEGEPADFRQLVITATKMGVDEIVLPDILRDSEGTLELSWQAAHLVPPKRRAFVPQGKTVDEWCACLAAAVNNGLEFATIMVPKHLEAHPEGRIQALAFIGRMEYHLTYQIHLLGIWHHMYSEVKRIHTAVRNGLVPEPRGLDTGAPVAQAQKGEPIKELGQPRASLSWSLPANIPLVMANCVRAQGWCLEAAK